MYVGTQGVLKTIITLETEMCSHLVLVFFVWTPELNTGVWYCQCKMSYENVEGKICMLMTKMFGGKWVSKVLRNPFNIYHIYLETLLCPKLYYISMCLLFMHVCWSKGWSTRRKAGRRTKHLHSLRQPLPRCNPWPAPPAWPPAS